MRSLNLHALLITMSSLLSDSAFFCIFKAVVAKYYIFGQKYDYENVLHPYVKVLFKFAVLSFPWQLCKLMLNCMYLPKQKLLSLQETFTVVQRLMFLCTVLVTTYL